jgi:hypothetical protein
LWIAIFVLLESFSAAFKLPKDSSPEKYILHGKEKIKRKRERNVIG